MNPGVYKAACLDFASIDPEVLTVPFASVLLLTCAQEHGHASEVEGEASRAQRQAEAPRHRQAPHVHVAPSVCFVPEVHGEEDGRAWPSTLTSLHLKQLTVLSVRLFLFCILDAVNEQASITNNQPVQQTNA